MIIDMLEDSYDLVVERAAARDARAAGLVAGGFISREHGRPAAREEPVHGRLRRRGRRLDEPPAEELHRGRHAAVEVDAVPERREHPLALGLDPSVTFRGTAGGGRGAPRRSRRTVGETCRAQRRVPGPEPPRDACCGSAQSGRRLAIRGVAAAGQRPLARSPPRLRRTASVSAGGRAAGPPAATRDGRPVRARERLGKSAKRWRVDSVTRRSSALALGHGPRARSSSSAALRPRIRPGRATTRARPRRRAARRATSSTAARAGTHG